MDTKSANDEGIKDSDKELIKDLKDVFQWFLDDQVQKKPRFSVQEIPGEIHGPLADILYVDKVDNQALVGFIISLLYQAKTDKEILWALNAVYSVLDLFEKSFEE